MHGKLFQEKYSLCSKVPILYFTLTHSCPPYFVAKMSIKFIDFIEIWFVCGKNAISLKSSEATEICDEVLWNNKHITCDPNSLYDRYIINKEIVKVGDVISETGRPLTWFEAKDKFLLHDSKLLNLSCIPAIWKSKLVAEHGQSNMRSAIKMPLGITCRTAYYMLLEPLIRPATPQRTLEISLNLCDPDWKKDPYVTTVNNNRIIITLFPVQNSE